MTFASLSDTTEFVTIEDCIEYLQNIITNWQYEYGIDYDTCEEIISALDYVQSGCKNLIETASEEDREYLKEICLSIDNANNAINDMMYYLDDDNIIEEEFIANMEDALAYISL